MARQAPHGTRTRYVGGCRCDDCKQANTEYSTKVRNRRNGMDEDTPARGRLAAVGGRGRPRLVSDTVRAEQVNEDGEYVPGRVEAAVLRELKMLSATESQPGLAEGVAQMARLLDSPKLATVQTSAMQRMQDGLEKLRSASSGRKGKLASVAALSRREDTRAVVNT